jgi:hypothetical protein
VEDMNLPMMEIGFGKAIWRVGRKILAWLDKKYRD